MDSSQSLRNPSAFVGFEAKDLPASSLVLARFVVERNIQQLHRDVEALGFGFRPHMSTLKTLEMTRLMLGNGKYRGVICSTLAEIEGAASLAQEGILDEALESSMGSSTTQSPWPIFLGIDVGARWSGVPSFSERIQELAHVAKESNTVEVLGFHADTRFASVGASEEDSCSENLEGVLEDTRYFGAEKAVVVPIELAPTYPMISSLTSKTPANVVVEQSAGQAPASIIELHPSNPPLTHLQHVPSKFTEPYHQALRLMTENGPIAFFKEGEEWEEFGNIFGQPGWGVKRMS
ncbi:hypothetical protein CEP52_013805 [Fusarium oligoseptatum]|uniref:Alanine racemase N-terminal domain-containing protein n=1 Tax=Fusarium oligoseptatum TaxID=2604345 RepID=A0A428SRP2_9HYPO|nr:hypothetical protein CEP52_013805 [Fusarium oligoseptatum]